MFIRGKAPPKSNPLAFNKPLFFHERGTPLVYLLLTNGTSFTHLVYNFASLLTAVNALTFKQESIIKIERFLDFIKP